MITDIHSEDWLVQQAFIRFLRERLGWENVSREEAISEDVVYWAQPFPFGTNGLTAF